MIVGKFFNGSGLGNMLHQYVATRVKATDLGVPFGMVYIDDGAGKEPGFKGQSFMNIDWGNSANTPLVVGTHEEVNAFLGVGMNVWHEKKVRENGVDISPYDPEFNFIQDNTIIEGEFQDSRYWEHREKEVDEWLKVEPLDMPDNLCVIGFRGGEFALYPDLFLTHDYWGKAVQLMINNHGIKRFEVHSDDIELARQFFTGGGYTNVSGSEFKFIHDIGINWRSMRFAKYAIIANSSFFILPRWLRQGKNDGAVTMSPRFWGRRNIKVWSLPQNFYRRFLYI